MRKETTSLAEKNETADQRGHMRLPKPKSCTPSGLHAAQVQPKSSLDRTPSRHQQVVRCFRN